MNTNSLENLAKANADHFNAHPVAHTVMTVALLGGAVVIARVTARRMAKIDMHVSMETGRYAN